MRKKISGYTTKNRKEKEVGDSLQKEKVPEDEMGEATQWEHDDEDEQIKILKQRGSKGFPQKRRKKIRWCSAIYQKEEVAGDELQRKKGRAKQIRKTKQGRLRSEFMASPNSEIAGGSIGDN
ncbi:hypothetical protein SLA2020_379160 [Shorea laevis]